MTHKRTRNILNSLASMNKQIIKFQVNVVLFVKFVYASCGIKKNCLCSLGAIVIPPCTLYVVPCTLVTRDSDCGTGASGPSAF